MNSKLVVTPAPHVTKPFSTNMLMFAVVIALMPTAISGVINFGTNALWMIIISVGCSFVFDLLFRFMVTKKFNIVDLSSLVTGLMVALVLPAKAPLYFAVIGSFLAIVIFKGCFGGLGRNILNPTAAARVVLGLMFSSLTLSLFSGGGNMADVGSPLSYFMLGDYSSITLRSLFFGTAPGAIGTASIFCILIAGVLLMLFSITNFVMPVCALATFILTVWLGKGSIAIIPFLFSGGFLFVAFFMLTDPVSSPLTMWGKLFYGLIFGALAGLFRVYFVMGETGVFVALIICNILAPLLDKIFQPHPIGIRRA